MTDITELAQSLKAAAIDAKELAIIARYSKAVRRRKILRLASKQCHRTGRGAGEGAAAHRRTGVPHREATANILV